jgi:hypothetical protein
MLADDPTPTWLVTHRPIWGVVRTNKGMPDPGTPYDIINVTQHQAAARAFPDGMPGHVTAVVSGHMHRFQAIGFAGQRPPQLVIGNSGMELSQTIPAPPPGQPKQPIRLTGIDGRTGWIVGLSDFGALDVSLHPGGTWTGRLVSPGGVPLATCDSRWAGPGHDRSVCTLE